MRFDKTIAKIGKAALRALAIGDQNLFVEENKTLGDLQEQILTIFAGSPVPETQDAILAKLTEIAKERSNSSFLRGILHSQGSTLSKISALAQHIEDSGFSYDQKGFEIDTSNTEARNAVIAARRAAAGQTSHVQPKEPRNIMPTKTNQTSTITLRELQEKATAVLGGPPPKRLNDFLALVRGKALEQCGHARLAVLEFETSGGPIHLAERLLNELAPTGDHDGSLTQTSLNQGRVVTTNAPSFAPSPTTTAASAPAYRAPTGAPSLPMLRALADICFGRGMAARTCQMPFVAASEEDRALLSKDIYLSHQHAKNVAEYNRRTKARQPTPAQEETFAREQLVRLFYKSGVEVPGLSYAGLNVPAADFGRVELKDWQLKIAQDRCNIFVQILSGGRFVSGNPAAEAAVAFMRENTGGENLLTVESKPQL